MATKHVLILGDVEKPLPAKVSRHRGRNVPAAAPIASSVHPRPVGGIDDGPRAEIGLIGRHRRPAAGVPPCDANSAAQAFMARHHIAQRHTQGADVEPASEAAGPTGMLQTGEGPCNWSTNHSRFWANDNGITAGLLNGHQRGRPFGGAHRRKGPAGHGRRLEHGAHRKFGIQSGVDRRHQAHGRDGVPTQIEERVADADPLHPEHLGRRSQRGSPRPDPPWSAVVDRHPDSRAAAAPGCRVCRSPSPAARRGPPPRPEPCSPVTRSASAARALIGSAVPVMYPTRRLSPGRSSRAITAA